MGTLRRPSSKPFSGRQGNWACSRTSTSPWMARYWKRGRVRRVINARMARTWFHRTILAMRRWTSAGRSGRTGRTHRRRTRMRRWHAKVMAAELQRESAGGEPQRADREHGGVRGQRNGGARCGADHAGTDSGIEAGNSRRRQGLRHGGFRGRVQKPESYTARGAESRAARWERDRCSYDAAPGIRHQPEEEEAGRRVLRMAQDDRAVAEGSAPWHLQGGLGLHLCCRCL